MDWEELLKKIETRPAESLVLAPLPVQQSPAASQNAPQAATEAGDDQPGFSEPDAPLPVSGPPDAPLGDLSVADATDGSIGDVGEVEPAPTGAEAALEPPTEPRIGGEILEIATTISAPAAEALEPVAPTPLRQDSVEVPSAPEAAIQPELDSPDQPQLRGDVLEIATMPELSTADLDSGSAPSDVPEDDLPVGRPARVSSFHGLRNVGQPASIPGSMQFPDGFVPLDEDQFIFDPSAPGSGPPGDDELSQQISADFEAQLSGLREGLQNEVSRVISEQQIMLTMAESDD